MDSEIYLTQSVNRTVIIKSTSDIYSFNSFLRTMTLVFVRVIK